jgi:hypothetical protein
MVKSSMLYIFGINTMEIYLEIYKVSENQNVFFVYIGKNAHGLIGSMSEIHISVFSVVVTIVSFWFLTGVIYLFITFTKKVKRQPALGCDLVAG